MTTYLTHSVTVTSEAFVNAYDAAPVWSVAHGNLLLDHVPLDPRAVVLDVGCGTGFPLVDLAGRLGPEARLYGIDPWVAGLARAQHKIDHADLRNVQLIVGDAERTGFPDGTFDLVVSNLGINNFADPPAVARECRRVLKPGGVLALTTNLPGHMAELYAVFRETLLGLGLPDVSDALTREENHRTTVPQALALFEGAGFRERRVVERTHLMRFASGPAVFHDAFNKLAFLDGWKNVVPAHERLRVFRRLEQDLTQLAAQTGGLALTIPMAYLELN